MKKIILSALALLTLASCSKSDEASFTTTDTEVRISSSITTRASGTKWASNDVIGVYMTPADGNLGDLGANVKYTTTDGSGNFTYTYTESAPSQLYYPASGSSDLLAYYPYDDSSSATAYPVKVGTQTTQANIDLMKAEKTVSKSTDAVELTFNHKLSRIVLNISAGGGLESDDLAGLEITLSGTKIEADYNLTLGDTSASLITFAQDAKAGDITMLTDLDKLSAEAIIIPQGSFTTAPTLTFTTDYNTYTATLTTTAFAVGQEYNYSVTINNTSVTISSATINPWDADEDDSDDILVAEPETTPSDDATYLTLAEVSSDDIATYSDTWVITDEWTTTTNEYSSFSALSTAANAAVAAGRNITVEFPNMVAFPGSSFASVVASSEEAGSISVSLPGVTQIGNSAFKLSTAVVSISAPTLESIDSYAFNHCSNLASFEIASSVTTIGYNPFYGCNSLTLTNNSENFLYDNGLLYSDNNKTSIIAGINKELSDNLELESSVTTINDYAFAYGDTLKSIKGAGVETIGSYAFYYNSSIESIDFEVLETISSNCLFSYCTALNSVSLPALATISSSNTFLGCTSLLSIALPKIIEVGLNTFKNCSSLTSLQLGSSDATSSNDLKLWVNYTPDNITTGAENNFEGFLSEEIAAEVDLSIYYTSLKSYNSTSGTNDITVNGTTLHLSSTAGSGSLTFKSITYNNVE